MTNNRRSLRNLSPDFAIPPGTQVVVTVDQNAEHGVAKKSGSVGVVTKAPPHNREPYLVRFGDESEILVPFEQLALRRREIENLLQAPENEDLSQFVIYKCASLTESVGDIWLRKFNELMI